MQEDLLLEIYQKRFRELIKEPHTDFLWPYNYDNFKDLFDNEKDFKTAIKVKCRKRNRRRRCFKKLEPIIKQYEESFFDKGEYCVLVFGTCTFDNDHMKWKEESRTKKINKWLKKHFVVSLANIDYGERNGREHHHFIGLTYELVEPTKKHGKSGFPIYELKNKDYDLGFEPDLEIINDLDNEKKLSNYLVKLNYHSNKKTTKNRRIRYLKR